VNIINFKTAPIILIQPIYIYMCVCVCVCVGGFNVRILNVSIIYDCGHLDSMLVCKGLN